MVLRRGNGSLDVLLCGRADPPLWALPKGGPEAGETLEATALREVTEETGVEVALKGKVGSLSYWFMRPAERTRCHKTVHFFLMAPVGGSTERHDAEFDYVQWFPVDQAVQVMTYSSEAEMVHQAVAITSRQED